MGQSTYRGNYGLPWVLPSVQQARRGFNEKGLVHEYLPILRLKGLREGAARYCTLREKGGAADADAASDAVAARKVYIPSTTWSNHRLLFSSLGFTVGQFNYYNNATRSLNIDSYLAALRSADHGSVVLLHACAHNPTSLDPYIEQWKQIWDIIKERRLFPIFDAAYLGLNSGDYDKDAWAIRGRLTEPGEGVGRIILQPTPFSQSVLESLQRSEISNLPAFRAKIAEAIMSDDMLKNVWLEDLKTMSGRIAEMRRAFSTG
ncbi:uncharacterized protein ANIA_10766 [Aspergillus nidulans FGSC A4]|uniref:Aminotransferase class I/classII large domain-containing protein n=1 Tax=Emericella nidulans (strain FGSC A4 / ATCC 38163 / CBS 112.46 / NRRL 194 / M139) TaxID=227321 RepID=C8V325_EMENI|nr:hypothetical protein [Aspergillus nidulans FGSC A4]CBF70346.1 TPA: conserved hypothetical protein [Aspergillus nidulans FGSC A4]